MSKRNEDGSTTVRFLFWTTTYECGEWDDHEYIDQENDYIRFENTGRYIDEKPITKKIVFKRMKCKYCGDDFLKRMPHWYVNLYQKK